MAAYQHLTSSEDPQSTLASSTLETTMLAASSRESTLPTFSPVLRHSPDTNERASSAAHTATKTPTVMRIQRPVDPRFSYNSNVVKRPRLTDGSGQEPSSAYPVVHCLPLWRLLLNRPLQTPKRCAPSHQNVMANLAHRVKPCIMPDNPADEPKPSSLNISTNSLHSQTPPSFRSSSLSVPLDTTKASHDPIKSRIIDKKKQLQSWRSLMEEFPSMSNTFTMQIERNERELQTLEMELEKASKC
ncbi:hypothetical protein C356_06350 [Cryptococcus neoformans c45]|nr:hypothetical protein C356_06350 [Cryptococcus neoformans var. grubii c45]